jgi:CBS domain-containing protein
MTRMPNIIYASPEDSAFVVAKKIIEHEIDSIPIIEREAREDREIIKMVGKVSKTNITKLFVRLGDS